jgi:two-component system cell cycle sensor histidine kinase/response regulator CckA
MPAIRTQKSRSAAEALQLVHSILGEDCSGAFVISVHRSGQFSYLSADASHIARHSRTDEALLGMQPRDAIPGELGERLEGELSRCVEEGRALDFAVPAPGYVRCQHESCVTTLHPLRDERGRIHRIIGSSHGAESNEKAERILVEMDRRFHRMLDDIPSVSVQGYSSTGIVRYWNRGSERLYGYTESEALGRHLLDLIIPPPMRDGVRQAVREMIETGVPVPSGELGLMRKDGSIVEVYSCHTLLEHSDGEREFFCIDVDLSEVKQGEAERNKLFAELDQARKLEAIGRLAGGVAHDFNNMLSVILGYTELAIADAEEGADVQESLDEVLHATQRSKELTQQLLGFARKQTIAPRDLDLNQSVQSLLSMIRRLLDAEISIRFEPDAKLWPVRLDPVQLDQILTNLCVNARDAIAGQGNIRIATGNVPDLDPPQRERQNASKGDYVRLTVLDDGRGIDQETREHIFEPFYTTKGEGKGTGLGLATVYGILKQNGGWIDVESTLGRGSAFSIFLPRLHGKVCYEEPSPKESAELANPRERILIVEDEPAILNLATSILKRCGYEVLPASTPMEALDLARAFEERIDLVLTDVVMPKMNGRELMSCLEEQRPGLRAVYMSGYSADVIAQRDLLGDGVSLLQKPFTAPELARRIRSVLDRDGPTPRPLVTEQ